MMPERVLRLTRDQFFFVILNIFVIVSFVVANRDACESVFETEVGKYRITFSFA